MSLPTFYTGGDYSTLVPGTYPMAFDGHAFGIDTASKAFEFATIPVLKPQSATYAVTDARSINPEGFWRRDVESWHHGAGQAKYDRAESDPYRFRSSKGIDCWTRYQISLLPATVTVASSASTNLYVQPAGARLYFSATAALKYVTAVGASASATTVTGTGAGTITSLASDGFTVWSAHTANGLYTTNTGTGAAAQVVSTALATDSVVGFVKGRLMVSKANSIYNVTDLVGPTALPTALFTHGNTNFVWVGFAEGPGFLYAAGYSGDKSQIYKATIKTDATTLDAPTVAGELPDGEIIRSLKSYLGLVLIGTDSGWWVGSPDASGNLTVNKVQTTSSAVRCFEGQGDFVWYGWSNYDSTSTGLGRADLTTDTKGASVVTPGYASDLMATAQGAVLDVCTFGAYRVFTVSGVGVFAETTTKVASGTISQGTIGFGIPENKNAVFLDVRHDELYGSVDAFVAQNGSTVFSFAGHSATALSTGVKLPLQGFSGLRLEPKMQLTQSSSDSTLGPVVTRVTLFADPTTDSGFTVAVPMLFSFTDNANGGLIPRSPQDELEFLEDRRSNRTVATLQVSGRNLAAVVEDYQFQPRNVNTSGEWDGTCLGRFKVFGQVDFVPDLVTRSGVSVSTDGAAFTAQSVGAGGVVYAAGAYSSAMQGWVVVGETGHIASGPPDGSSWVLQASGVSSALLGVCASDDERMWVVVGGSGVVLTSADGGATWVSRTSGVATSISGIARSESDDLWVYVGESGVIRTSPDAVTWTSRTSNTANQLYAVARSDSTDLWVAVGQQSAGGTTVHTSSDGITWTSTDNRASNSDLRTVCHSESLALWVAAGNSGHITTSPDAVTWTERTSGTADEIDSVAWSSSHARFLAVTTTSHILSSPDGITWTDLGVTTGATSVATA